MLKRFGFVAFVFALSGLGCAPHHSSSCREITYKEQNFMVCHFIAGEDDMRMFLTDENQRPYYTFANVQKALAAQNEVLLFGMNAGMYDKKRNPVGLYVEDGQKLKTLNLKSGKGNFHMMPNGVFSLNGTDVRIEDSASFKASKRKVKFATQSGPLLVIGGELHPRFQALSKSKYIRNGVGVSGRNVYFVISNETVNFYTFASIFKDVLKTPNALYLDGAVSKVYVPDFNRHDYGRAMGPMIGVVGSKVRNDER